MKKYYHIGKIKNDDKIQTEQREAKAKKNDNKFKSNGVTKNKEQDFREQEKKKKVAERKET